MTGLHPEAEGRDALELEMEAAFEAILFVTAEPAPIEDMLAVFPSSQRETAERALERVFERYRAPTAAHGVLLDRVAGGVRLVTRPELHEHLRRFFEVSGTNRLSIAALETLAIVAYRQPITAPEIQELRGKNSAGVLKTLLERRLIRISGRKEVVGRPFLYATTRDFLLHFGLSDLSELPPLEEFEEALSEAGGFSGLDESRPVAADREETMLRQLALVEEAESAAEDEE